MTTMEFLLPLLTIFGVMPFALGLILFGVNFGHFISRPYETYIKENENEEFPSLKMALWIMFGIFTGPFFLVKITTKRLKERNKFIQKQIATQLSTEDYIAQLEAKVKQLESNKEAS